MLWAGIARVAGGPGLQPNLLNPDTPAIHWMPRFRCALTQTPPSHRLNPGLSRIRSLGLHLKFRFYISTRAD